MGHDTDLPNLNELERKGIEAFSLIKLLSSDQKILESVKDLNFNYYTSYDYATAIEDVYYQVYYPVLNYFQENYELLYSSLSLINSNEFEIDDFLSVVPQNSAKWIKPATVFYPKIIKNQSIDENLIVVSEDDLSEITSWIKTYYPVKNDDNTLNYLENSLFIINAYVYDVTTDINILDQPQSYSYCVTQQGIIRLHCQTIIRGGFVYCHQGTFNCDATRNCYPTLNVDCWYEDPYLKKDGTVIKDTDPISVKQIAMSKIQANLQMNYKDRRENSQIANLVFKVVNCDWVFTGTRILQTGE